MHTKLNCIHNCCPQTMIKRAIEIQNNGITWVFGEIFISANGVHCISSVNVEDASHPFISTYLSCLFSLIFASPIPNPVLLSAPFSLYVPMSPPPVTSSSFFALFNHIFDFIVWVLSRSNGNTKEGIIKIKKKKHFAPINFPSRILVSSSVNNIVVHIACDVACNCAKWARTAEKNVATTTNITTIIIL